MGSFIRSPLFGYVLALMGIAVSIYLYKKGKRIKRISFFRQTNWLIGPNMKTVPALQIQYNEKEISNLAVSCYTIWNSGNEPIKNSDMVSTRPLEIRSKSGNILDAQIYKVSEDSCDFLINKTDDTVSVKFNYINPNDGVVIQIAHSGSLFDLDGKIMGGTIAPNEVRKHTKRISKISRLLIPHSKRNLAIWGIIGVLSITLITVFVSLCAFGYVTESSKLHGFLFDKPSQISLLIEMVFFWLLTILFSRLVYVVFAESFQYGIPKSLKINTESLDSF